MHSSASVSIRGRLIPSHTPFQSANPFKFNRLATSPSPPPSHRMLYLVPKGSHMKKPISEKQLAANRANATRSTGPRSPEGKARSSQNARKHGFAAASFQVNYMEDPEAVANLKADLVSVYQPVNAQELFALERIAIAQQAVLRIARLEAGLHTSALDLACFYSYQTPQT